MRTYAVKVSEETVIVNRSDEEEHLHPAESWDRIDGGNTVGDIGKLEARGDFTRESEKLRDNVSDHSKHGRTSVLEFRNAVRFKVLFRGQIERIKKSSRRKDTGLVLDRAEGRRATALGSRSKGSGGSSEDGKESELHRDRFLEDAEARENMRTTDVGEGPNIISSQICSGPND